MKEYEKDRGMCLLHAPKFSKTTHRYKEWKSTCWKYWWHAGKISKMFVNIGYHSKMFNIFCGNGIETHMDILHVQKVPKNLNKKWHFLIFSVLLSYVQWEEHSKCTRSRLKSIFFYQKLGVFQAFIQHVKMALVLFKPVLWLTHQDLTLPTEGIYREGFPGKAQLDKTFSLCMNDAKYHSTI